MCTLLLQVCNCPNEDSMGDGICDADNLNIGCGFDKGDCCDESLIGNSECNDGNKFTQCQFDGGDCCTDVLIGNGICTDVNNFPTCQNYDGGDCRPPNITEWPKCPHNPGLIGDGNCDDHLKTKSECNYDDLDCCPNRESFRDGECNPENLNNVCMNDGGDCCNKDIGSVKMNLKCFNFK